MIPGWATEGGTLRFAERFQGRLAEGHFRLSQGLRFSSIGVGTYLGDSDEETDRLYAYALEEAIRSGVNVIDSAINYRCQRSERVIGQVLGRLVQAGSICRDEVVVCTKGGYLPFDGEFPGDSGAYFRRTYLDTGILSPDDIAQGCHAMSPKYLEDQLNRSLRNLGIATIDIYYLHNPETQLADVSREEFLRRLQVTFQFLEEKVAQGKIRRFGMATWDGFRVPPDSYEYLSLEELVVLARQVGGPHHHFQVVQLPVNLAMPEAWVFRNQAYGASECSFLEAAQRLVLTVVASASLLQGKLTYPLPSQIVQVLGDFRRPAQASLQFVRSLPGLTTALVGMKRIDHVRENLELAKAPTAKEEELLRLFSRESA